MKRWAIGLLLRSIVHPRWSFPTTPPGIEHPDDAVVRKVISSGRVRWKGQLVFVNTALTGEEIAILECPNDRFEFRFGPIHLGFFDPRRPGLGLVRAERSLRKSTFAGARSVT